MTSVPVGTCRISRNNLTHNYLENKRFFVDFLLHFLNVHEIQNIWKKKDEYPSLILSKIIDSEGGGYLNV